MTEREPQDAESTQPVEASGSAPGERAAQPAPPVSPAWAIPSPATAASTTPGPTYGPTSDVHARSVSPTIETPTTAPGGISAAAPAGPAGTPMPPSDPLRRRRAVVGVAGAGAAVLLAAAGFLAGTQFGAGSDRTSLVSGQSSQAGQSGQSGPAGPMDGYGHGGQGDGDVAGGRGGQGVPGGQLPGDGSGPMGGAAAGSGVAELAVAGRITAIDGSTLTLTTFQGGSTVTVTTTSATSVAGTAGGDLSALTVGQIVFVAGSRTADNAYQATAIMTRPTRHADDASDQGGQGQDQGQGQPGEPALPRGQTQGSAAAGDDT